MFSLKITTMKRMKFILILFLLFVICNDINANNNNGKEDDIVVPITEEKKVNTDRPRTPSLVSTIWFHYNSDNGTCSFDVPAGIEALDVTILLDDSIYFNALVNTEAPSFQLFLTPGTYSIRCISDDGRLFSAYFSI